MPGPSSRGNYVGRTKGLTIALEHQRRAAHVGDLPRCRVCGAPMTVGQELWNGGAHRACSPGPT